MLMPLDMEGLVDSLHKNGINVRYLGHIYKSVCQTQNSYFKRLIERTIYVRCFVKLLRKMTFELNNETLLALFVHFINLFLGGNSQKK